MNSCPPDDSKKVLRRGILIIAILAAALITIFLLAYSAVSSMDLSWTEFWAMLKQNLGSAALIVLALFSVKTILWVIPLYGLYLGAGYLFPFPVAVAMCLGGLAAEFTLGYLLGRLIGRPFIANLMNRNRHSARILRIMDEHHSLGCFVIRLIPGPPLDLINLFLGSIHIHYGKYLLFSLLGLMPAMIPILLAGRHASSPWSVGFILPIVVAVAVSVLAIYLIQRAGRKSFKKESFEKE